MTERDESGTPVDPELETADSATRRRGRIRQQDENTTPREPTLAERRARERAERRRREEEEQRLSAEAAGRKKRKRIFIGAGVTVGIVALIAVGYAVAQPDDEIEAQCVDEETGVIVDDSNCAVPASNNTYYGGGFYPIFLGIGGRQYHYNYGGTGTIGQTVAGGTTTVPKDGTRVRTSSGSSTVTRGGLGVGSSSSSDGGSKAGSKSSSGSSGGSKSGGS